MQERRAGSRVHGARLRPQGEPSLQVKLQASAGDQETDFPTRSSEAPMGSRLFVLGLFCDEFSLELF